ncbi:MFS transporter [Streptomyces sp. DHE17-7]|nr:MFS transporter [Streptomyces sp. DHE17-7]
MQIVGELVPPRERGRYQGLISGAMAVAMIGGPMAGGAVTDHLGWRWAFYLNLPLGAHPWHICGLGCPDGPGALSTWRRCDGGSPHRPCSPRQHPYCPTPPPGCSSPGRPPCGPCPAQAPPRPDHAAPHVPGTQLHADVGDRFPHRLRDVRGAALPAPVPAGRPGRLGDQLRPAAAADAGRADRGVAGGGQGHHGQRPLQGVPGDRRRPAVRRGLAAGADGHLHLAAHGGPVHGGAGRGAGLPDADRDGGRPEQRGTARRIRAPRAVHRFFAPWAAASGSP